MIISLTDAQLINSNLTPVDLDGMEASVRRLTNNNFQNRGVRFNLIAVNGLSNALTVDRLVHGLRAGDTVEINDSVDNAGVYTVTQIDGDKIVVNEDLLPGKERAIVTKVEYPADIKAGVLKWIQYDVDHAKHEGVKSRSVGRVNETYFDTTSSKYPDSYMSFLTPYKKMRWS